MKNKRIDEILNMTPAEKRAVSNYVSDTGGAQIKRAAKRLEESGIKVNKIYEGGAQPIGPYNRRPDTDSYAFGGMVPPQNMAEGGVVQGFTNVLNPDGEVVSLPNNELQAAFESGYQVAPKEQIEQARMKRDYGEGFGNELLATGAGALRGATLGLSDLALTSSGLADAKTLAALKEFNPNASLAGEIGGAAAAMFTPSGPVAAIGRVGKATSAGIKALNAAKLAQEGSTAAKVLGAAEAIGSTAAGSAAEGALYTGVGNSITEYSLGDPNLNGEKVLANFGHGALWGGALGGAFKGAAIGIPEGIKAAKSGITKIRDLVLGTGMGDEGAILGLVDKIDPSLKLSDAIRNRAITLDVDKKAELIDGLTSNLNSVKKNIDTSIRKLNDTIRPAEIDALIDTAASPKVVHDLRQTVVDTMNGAVKKMRAEPELFDPRSARILELQRDGIVNRMGKETTPAQILGRLKEVKQNLDSIVYDKMSPAAATARDLIDEVNGTIRSAIHNPDTFGLAGSAQSAHDTMLSKLYGFVSPNVRKPTEFQKAFMKKTGYGPKAQWAFDRGKVEAVIKSSEKDPGKFQMLDDYFEVLRELPEHLENTFANVPNSLWDATKFVKMPGIIEKAGFSATEAQMKYLEAAQNMKGRTLGLKDLIPGAIATQIPVVGAAYQVYNIATKPIEYINKLATIERLIGKTTNAIGRGSKAIFDPSIKVVERSRTPLMNLTYDEKVGHYRQLAEQFADHTNNSDAMIEALNEATGHMSDVAPDGTAALQRTAIVGSQFLSSKIPFPPQLSPFSKPYIPSQTELADFEHYMNVVENPVDALQEVRLGTLTPATVETLQIVYPQLYAEMKARVIDSATDAMSKGEEIPYRVKQSLSLFLGQPIDESLAPESVIANQMAYLPKTPPPQAGVKPNVGGMSKMTIASRTKTRQDRPE